MAKPEGAKTRHYDMDLTYTALEDAAELLPASKVFRLVVHPERIREANKWLGEHVKVINENPLSPGIEVVGDPLITDLDEWRLEGGGQVFWSPGA